MKILITGADGFVGKHICDFFEKKPHFKYLGLVRAIKETEHYKLKKTNYKLTELIELLNWYQPDVLIHLAAQTSRTRDFTVLESMTDANVLLTNNLLQACAQAPNKIKFIYLSTAEVYGHQEGMITELTETRPVSPYGLSKKWAEDLCINYQNIGYIDLIILRLFNTFGPHQSPGFFISDLLDAVQKSTLFHMTKGEQKRDFLFIEDVVRALVFFCEYKSIHTVFNLSSGEVHSLASIVEKLQAKLPILKKLLVKDLPYRENELWQLGGNNEKLLQTGFRLKYSFEDELLKLTHYV